MRVTYVQYAGDYRDAFDNFSAGGAATYQGQRRSVDFVGELAGRFEQVTVVCAVTSEAYDEILSNGVRAIGAGLQSGYANSELIPVVARTSPDRLIVKTPSRQLIRWGAKQRIRMLLSLADSFQKNSLRKRISNWLLARELNRPAVEWVGNHGLNACLSLMDIGVDPNKIIPWDLPPAFSPHDQEPRNAQGGTFKLVYIGTVSEQKGVGDLLDAMALLRAQNASVNATIYGPDRDGAMARKAAQLDLVDLVTLPGSIPNEEVVRVMQAADAVVVPSRHEYPEGLPLTIYEALSSRTPIIASDHPMFRGALSDGYSATIFRASDPANMARKITELAGNTDLYLTLSTNSATAWDALQLPVGTTELADRWLSEDQEWLKSYSVSSGIYDERLARRRTAMERAVPNPPRAGPEA